MSATRITFTVLGKAQTAGSKRAFVLRRKDGSLVTRPNGAPAVNVVDDNANSKQWQRTVAWEARRVFTGELMRGAVGVEFTFYRPRPKSHYGAHGLNKIGRESAHPTTKPDVLKLSRAIEDSLTGVVWADDAQIVDEVLHKRWGEPARVEIVIYSMLMSIADVRAQQDALPLIDVDDVLGIDRELIADRPPF